MTTTYSDLDDVRCLRGTYPVKGPNNFVPNAIGRNRKEGSLDPDFRTKIQKRVDAASAYTRHVCKYDQHLLEVMHRYLPSNGGPYIGRTYDSGNLSPVYNIPLTNETIAADDIALKRLKGRLARNVDQFSALVPLAEIKETRNLIRSTTQLTHDLIVALLELKRGRVRNLVRKVSSAWLQFSFAISPTISDTNDLLNSIASYLLRDDHRVVVRGDSKIMWSDTLNSAGSIDAYPGISTWVPRPSRHNHSYQVQYTAGLDLQLSSANNYGIQDHFGLSFDELPSVLWELTVFSWVFDYFGTVGAYLEDVFQAPPGNTIYCTKSVKYTLHREQDWDLRVSSPSVYSTELKKSQTMTVDDVKFQRTVLNQIPHRALRFKTADEIGLNSVNKLLNLASILLS